jgi:hypothetical protein
VSLGRPILVGMAFGQTSGPPATNAQLSELLDLFAQVGFDGFREARHPYGLTQRQSNGKFSRTEADELLERLRFEVEVGESDGTDAAAESAAVQPATEPAPHQRPGRTEVAPPAVDDVVLAFPDEVLADELRRRGWACIPPEPEVS